MARDIVEHSGKRLEAMDAKAMVVCMSRRIGLELYDEIVKLRPAWAGSDWMEAPGNTMTIIPIVRCHNLRESLAFYTSLPGFRRIDGNDGDADPAFCALSHGGSLLYLSSHHGDGEYGQAIVIRIDDADREWQILQSRGLHPAANPESPVHNGPVDQTLGTRDFYVDDPDGNTLRFVQEK